MTRAGIEGKAHLEAIRHETAIAIRELLDKAHEAFDEAGGDWNGDDVEASVLALVADEDP